MRVLLECDLSIHQKHLFWPQRTGVKFAAVLCARKYNADRRDGDFLESAVGIDIVKFGLHCLLLLSSYLILLLRKLGVDPLLPFPSSALLQVPHLDLSSLFR